MFSGKRKWLLLIPALYFLFFFFLTAAGLVGPDEPRYAAIGRDMAQSGDWITPRLWGEPWFEKPALLYWMIALGNLAGLGPDLAPRLPVTLLSVAFLVFFHRVLNAEFGRQPAWFATVMLGTSAGWLAFSHLALPDLPMSAAFAGAMLLGMRWISTGKGRLLGGAAASLGLAVLAKGLVPLVLALPLFWMGRNRLRDWMRPLPLAAFFLVAAPWYVLCTVQNGSAFLADFFGKHHFERFWAGSIHHPQPFWFFVPVLLAGLFPWTPVLALLFRRSFYHDSRRRLLLAWIVFGFVFFSISTNKLPGYLLPLFPAIAALAGVALAEVKDARWVLAAVCLMLLPVPLIAETLPSALMAGLSRAEVTGWHWPFAITFVLLAFTVWFWEEAGRREAALALLLIGVTVSVLFLKVRALPRVDRLASARRVWQGIEASPRSVCVQQVHRNWRFGLNYYAGAPLPECEQQPGGIRVMQIPGNPPFVFR